jgi:hypothetical protein
VAVGDGGDVAVAGNVGDGVAVIVSVGMVVYEGVGGAPDASKIPYPRTAFGERVRLTGSGTGPTIRP